MFENQNANNNSFLRNSLTNMMANNRAGQLNSNFMPVGFGQTSSGVGGSNFLPINQQMPAVSTPSTQDVGAPGSKPPVTTPPSYVPAIQTRDAQGKTLPQYRMGIGHRILGTLTNFANGFAGNHAQPIYVGPGALNNRYYQDERQRRQNLEAAQQELDAIQGP